MAAGLQIKVGIFAAHVAAIALLAGAGCSKRRSAEPTQSRSEIAARDVVTVTSGAADFAQDGETTVCSTRSGCARAVRDCVIPRGKSDGFEVAAIWVPKTMRGAEGSGCISVVIGDPKKSHLELHSSMVGGVPKSASEWLAEGDARIAVMNAAMFDELGRPIGRTVREGRVLVERVNEKLGGYLAFGAKRAEVREVEVVGRECGVGNEQKEGKDQRAAEVDARVLADYWTSIQNYRLLGCDGAAIRWADPKIYSAAAIGVTVDGSPVFFHSRTAMKMGDFAQALRDGLPELAGAIYVEGGPEASLSIWDKQCISSDTASEPAGLGICDARGIRTWVGSFESDFYENDSNRLAWPLPSVVVLARGAAK